MAVTTARKSYKTTPKIRVRQAFNKVVESGGNVSISAAMREVGYSKATAKTPSKLTKSKGWQELMDSYLPDSLLAKKHKEFLITPRHTRMYKRGDLEYETEETDPAAVKALDMAYKLKRRYGDINVGQAIVLNISGAAANKYGIKSNTAPTSPAEQKMALDDARVISPPNAP